MTGRTEGTMRLACTTGMAVLAMLALLAAPGAASAAASPTVPAARTAAPAAPAARPLVHRWSSLNYKGHVRLWGTWSKSGRSMVISGRMKDSLKDGRWMRVQVEGQTARGREVAQDDFVFNGGKRVYVTPRYQYSGARTAHAAVRVCELRSMFGRARSCGRWHRIF